MATFKLQSAMEYLMTYGWALLIISVVIVALVSIGIFNNPLGSTCIASEGYTCQINQYSATTGNIVVTIGQDSGSTWTSANIVFVNNSAQSAVTASGLSSAQLTPMPSGDANTLANGLPSSVTTTVTLPASGTVRVGSSISGYIWASYSTGTSNGATIQAQVAQITVKAQ